MDRQRPHHRFVQWLLPAAGGALLTALIGAAVASIWHPGANGSAASVPPTPTPILAQAAPGNPTPTPQVQPSDTPVPPPPVCGPGCVLYHANWTNGMNGWNSTASGWTAADGQLLYQGGGSTSYPPYQLPENTSNYAVEAQIEMIQNGDCGSSWGIALGDTYQAGGYIDVNCNRDAQKLRLGNASADTSVDNNWHTFRVEVRGNNLQLFYDGHLAVQATDNSVVGQRMVGVFAQSQPTCICGTVQIAVRAFTITHL
jgi:hypothetical protein